MNPSNNLYEIDNIDTSLIQGQSIIKSTQNDKQMSLGFIGNIQNTCMPGINSIIEGMEPQTNVSGKENVDDSIALLKGDFNDKISKYNNAHKMFIESALKIDKQKNDNKQYVNKNGEIIDKLSGGKIQKDGNVDKRCPECNSETNIPHDDASNNKDMGESDGGMNDRFDPVLLNNMKQCSIDMIDSSDKLVIELNKPSIEKNTYNSSYIDEPQMYSDTDMGVNGLVMDDGLDIDDDGLDMDDDDDDSGGQTRNNSTKLRIISWSLIFLTILIIVIDGIIHTGNIIHMFGIAIVALLFIIINFINVNAL